MLWICKAVVPDGIGMVGIRIKMQCIKFSKEITKLYSEIKMKQG